jgi:hypothetical protein
MNSKKKLLKGKPRGRPFVPGISGNPQGRPLGSKHKTTMAMLEGFRRAEEKPNKPVVLDRTLPCEVWSD